MSRVLRPRANIPTARTRAPPSGPQASRARARLAARYDRPEFAAEIEAIHRESRGTYGVLRIHAELAAPGIHVGGKRVARSMRGAGPQGVTRREPFRTTVRDETARPAPDLVNRQFTTAGPNQLWVADITVLPLVPVRKVNRQGPNDEDERKGAARLTTRPTRIPNGANVRRTLHVNEPP